MSIIYIEFAVISCKPFFSSFILDILIYTRHKKIVFNFFHIFLFYIYLLLFEYKEPDELGPGTIVGSAAFNLLVIAAICVVCIPDGEVRRIKDIGVFLITVKEPNYIKKKKHEPENY